MHTDRTTAGGLALYTVNVGPAGGANEIGTISAPGLYWLLADNASGKSHHLRLLAQLHDEKALAKSVSITDGQLSAEVHLGARAVYFRRSPTGGIKVTSAEGEAPPIAGMPQPIEELITGGHLRGEEPRLHRRLAALLSYAPVGVTPERMETLLAVCLGRRWTTRAEMPPEMRAAWSQLAEAIGGGRYHETPLDADAIARLLADDAEADESVLDAHGRLVDRLNAAGNSAEKISERQAHAVAAAEGRLEEALRVAGVGAGELAAAAPVAEVRRRADEAQDRVVGLAAERRRMEEEERRREELRSSHGERPVVDEAPAQSAREALRAASEDAAKATESWHRAQEAAAQVDGRRSRAQEAMHSAARALDRRFGAVMAAVYRRDPGSVAVGDGDVLLDPASIRDPLAALVVACDEMAQTLNSLGPEVEAIEAAAAHEELTRAMAASASRAQTEAAADAAVADAALQDARRRLERWEAVDRLLAEPVTGPSADDLAAARAVHEAASGAVRVAEAAESYRDAAARLERERDLHEWLEAMGRDYRQAAADSWAALGGVVTAALALPWLRCDGLRLVLLYDRETGRLRLDPDRPEEERDLDDQARVSAAELREACLRLLVERQRGGWVILPWEVTAALDGDRARRLSGWLAEAGIVGLSERPRRDGDAEGLHLEYVEPVVAAVEEVAHA